MLCSLSRSTFHHRLVNYHNLLSRFLPAAYGSSLLPTNLVLLYSSLLRCYLWIFSTASEFWFFVACGFWFCSTKKEFWVFSVAYVTSLLPMDFHYCMWIFSSAYEVFLLYCLPVWFSTAFGSSLLLMGSGSSLLPMGFVSFLTSYHSYLMPIYLLSSVLVLIWCLPLWFCYQQVLVLLCCLWIFSIIYGFWFFSAAYRFWFFSATYRYWFFLLPMGLLKSLRVLIRLCCTFYCCCY